MNRVSSVAAALALAAASTASGLAQAPKILFIRGANGTGGLAGGANNHLTDIGDYTATTGNTGWGTFADLLRAAPRNYIVEQIVEGGPTTDGCVAVGLPVDFPALAGLATYKVLVFGSNNARYSAAQTSAVLNFIRQGGAALFISDANYGRDWRTAANSDQDFLSSFGLAMNQDRGTYSLTRTGGDFLVPDHPILAGVDTFDGEGVSPIRYDTVPAEMRHTIVVRAKNLTRDNNGTCGVSQGQGTGRAVTTSDAALIVTEYGLGRAAFHFDRNTFFNANGAGTSLVRFQNTQYTVNLFAWLVEAGSVRFTAWAQSLPDDSRGFSQDSDADSAANGLEYALGTNAGAAADGAATIPLASVSGSPALPRVRLDFSIASPPRGDVEIAVEVGDDLIGWTVIARKRGFGAWTGTAAVAEGATAAGRQMISVTDSVVLQPKAFARLRVSQIIP